MNDLLIVTKIKQTTIYINKILINFPKNEIILKHHIEIDLYDLLRYIYEANYNKENRISILYKSLIKIKMLDFYIRICLEKNIVSYKKVDGKFYWCDENGKVEDNASEVNVSDKNLIEYTSSNSKNLSVGSAGYSNNFLHLGDGFDNASYEDSGYRKGYTQGLADGLTTKSGTAKDLGYFGLQTIPTGLTSIKAIAVRIDGRYASGQMRNWVATYSAIGDVYASGGNICINYTTSGLNPGVGDGTVYWYAIGE